MASPAGLKECSRSPEPSPERGIMVQPFRTATGCEVVQAKLPVLVTRLSWISISEARMQSDRQMSP